MAWTDEDRAAVISQYVDAEPTEENSMEIVKELAEEFDQSPNGVRMILTKANVYVKKSASTPAAAKEGTGTVRVSKAAAQDALTAAIVAAGHTADQDIISKLTGKAAQYFTGLFADPSED
jgi:ribosome recycling factor